MRKVERKQTRMLREALKEERCVGGYAMFSAVELAIVRLVKFEEVGWSVLRFVPMSTIHVHVVVANVPIKESPMESRTL